MKNGIHQGEQASLSATSRSLTRREWVQRMLAGAGAGVAAPALAGARPAVPRALPGATPAAPQAGAAGDWKPAFLDDHQNEVLIAMGERIVPGSTAAQVNRFIDLALSAETQATQQKFVTSLNAVEGESLRRFTKSFKDLSAEQMDEILTAASTAQPAERPRLEDPSGMSGAAPEPPAPSLRDYFDNLKGWISMAFYTSEVGMKELGWTDQNFFESFPGCEHSGTHS
jgi:hypothetical protein